MVLWALVVANLKMILRNRQSLFWALAFPLIFVAVFALFDLDGTPTTTVAVVDQARDDVSVELLRNLEGLETFELEYWNDEAAARVELEDGAFRFLLVIPEGLGEAVQAGRPSGVRFVYDEGSITSAIVIGVISSFLDDVSFGLSDAAPLLNLSAEGIRAERLDYFDFLLPGLVGMGVMMYSIIGLASVLTAYREQKILKRVLATPLKVRNFFGGMVVAHLVLALLQTAVILGAGVFILDGNVLGNIFFLAVVVVLGNLVFLSIGFIVGSIAKSVGAASGLGNAVAMPMMFLSGVFFPTDSLPRALEVVVSYLPLAPMLEAMRGIALDAKSLTDFPTELGLLAGWVVLTAALAVKTFRFD